MSNFWHKLMGKSDNDVKADAAMDAYDAGERYRGEKKWAATTDKNWAYVPHDVRPEFLSQGSSRSYDDYQRPPDEIEDVRRRQRYEAEGALRKRVMNGGYTPEGMEADPDFGSPAGIDKRLLQLNNWLDLYKQNEAQWGDAGRGTAARDNLKTKGR